MVVVINQYNVHKKEWLGKLGDASLLEAGHGSMSGERMSGWGRCPGWGRCQASGDVKLPITIRDLEERRRREKETDQMRVWERMLYIPMGTELADSISPLAEDLIARGYSAHLWCAIALRIYPVVRTNWPPGSPELGAEGV